MVASVKPKQHRNIYKHGKRYEISKRINNKTVHFGSYNSLAEAMKVRDKLKANNWQRLPKTPEQKLREQQYFYYHRIYLSPQKKRYYINNKDGLYIGVTETIEEALYYRDLYSDLTDRSKTPKPVEVDLKTNNPYIRDGLEVPIPKRLIPPPPKKSDYGTGAIRKRDNHYRIEHGSRYFTSCVTYEQAYYYKQELNKRGWNKENLKEIEKDYPAWYTWLNKFYIYILKREDKWLVVLTPNNNPNGKLEHIPYTKLEDALFERDFLLKHNWDYNLLVEAIDDAENQYYDMELPPYPERKIRNISLDRNRDEELEQLRSIIYEHPEYSQEEVADALNIAPPTIRNWLKKYDCPWEDFKRLSIHGENPLEYYTCKEHIYQPDLSRAHAKHFTNYVHRNSQSQVNPWKIVKDAKHYGVYPTRELADKISNELQKLGWSKENLKMLQEKYNCKSKLNTKRWVYSTNKGKAWAVRHKNKERKMINYGTYHDKPVAEAVRDMLIIHDWDKKRLPYIQELVKEVFHYKKLYENNMFGGIRL